MVAIILAAGKGTRMRSRLVKVLHPFLGRPMVLHAVDSAFRAGAERVVTVVGHQGDNVRATIDKAFSGWNLGYAEQSEQRGTGHAVQCGMAAVGEALNVLVIYGDTPLLTPQTLSKMLTSHRQSGATMTVATFENPNPTGYGRIVREPAEPTSDGAAVPRVVGIVEEADASDEQKRLTEVNAGMCVIKTEALVGALARLTPHNKQGELYLTDIVADLAGRGERVEAYLMADAIEASGINTRFQLATLEEVALTRMRQRWMDRGVSMQDPGSIRIDADVDIGEDTLLGPNVQLLGKTRIGAGCRIDAGAIVDGCELGDFVHIKAYSVVTGSRLATRTEVGPFAHLRPGTELGEKAKVGNFVETKKAKFGAGSKASHLSYLGDCELGREVNVGAGTITCNYDGVDKHRTVIGDHAFIGSDTQLVAPVIVGRYATIGAGTTVTKDVPEGALAVSRSEQRHFEGYYERRRKPREDRKKAERAAKKGGE
ncbi:MAG TPA: bifunctional UDP-N-acetylglucosamine diphosphorylase/glucosamine-1-phosphate N-acetyltransferase GlmU [Myxococcota bacterium]|nr:bifunctional UDP-N-acetylglucosamine diphosphorylase/glucosamine-1-phosphate N-acetyltransferase GlmU [Myxococcota bacterium]